MQEQEYVKLPLVTPLIPFNLPSTCSTASIRRGLLTIPSKSGVLISDIRPH